VEELPEEGQPEYSARMQDYLNHLKYKQAEEAEAARRAASRTDPSTSGFSMDAPDQDTEEAPAVEVVQDTEEEPTVDGVTFAPPVWYDKKKAVNMLDRFRKGGEQSAGDAFNNLGFNAETAGYLFNNARVIAGADDESAAGPITTNITYQQPINTYLARRAKLRGWR
jgi:hypothetical protein